jgi:hypothetical protein
LDRIAEFKMANFTHYKHNLLNEPETAEIPLLGFREAAF